MTISSHSDLEGMRRVGRLVALTLAEMRAALRPGVTTEMLDDVAARFATGHGARSAPRLTYDFPGFTCISVNEEIVHGIPGARVVRGGDVVKLDVTLELDGFIADSAVTAVVPPASAEARRLQRCARSAFNQAMQVARAGSPLSGLGLAVEREVARAGFAVVRELGGHGVGRRIHERPSVPNHFDASVREILGDGLVIAVEPMVTALPARVVEEPDGWTLRTHNRALAAHHEHTIVIRRGAPLVLTAA
ncbi:MAG TPA: type I methionyl aminopeptidase [Gemmatimonadaceae bacterium]|nr:type I methionyl aminopeptidase [Gemmatimonadaceae bacterium]